MPGPPTPNLGLTVPTVTGDIDAWGTEMNANLALLDGLGAAGTISISANTNAVLGIFPETIVRVTTGSGVVTFTLLAPSAGNAGRIWTVKKVDAGAGNVNIVAAGGALIDGFSSYTRAIQNSYARFLSNGAGGYDVIGGN
jgi:hypothetical protein